ncbi:GAF domain-containing protein [Sphingomonas sp. Leaf62]|uniref:GAF domain-containing protein n=1 Tax=Sphingomonas sp. Leaf62 TaxID=1736228 RepID=UPI0007023A82|nr:GAF domain-containing protein [Sphingomonas sp. Leaf62]KQN76643.1 histidine kinase [Sphingomonas sp. Leaf62]
MQRQAAVDRTGITRRANHPALQSIVEDAARLAKTPIAAVTIIDRARQWFAARIGLDAEEGPRSEAFCAHTILRPGEPLIVLDTLADVRFVRNPAVIEAPHIRFYAGIPLVNRAGYALGALCVADTEPRLDTFDIYALSHLARTVERLVSST